MDEMNPVYDCNEATLSGAEIGGVLGEVAGGVAAIYSGAAGTSFATTIPEVIQAVGAVDTGAAIGEYLGESAGAMVGYAGCEVGNSLYDTYQGVSDYINGYDVNDEPDMSSPANDGYLV
jgi:hypothetical protein